MKKKGPFKAVRLAFCFCAFLAAFTFSSVSASAYDIQSVGVSISKDDIGENANIARGGIVYNCGGLNVRSGPGTDNPIIGGLAPGAGVQIIGREGKWYKINYNGSAAFVHGDYVNTAGSPVGAEESLNDSGAVRVSTYLNVRTAPWGNIVGKLYDGAGVRIIGKCGDWYKINYNGSTAYVHSNFVARGVSGASSARRSASADDGESRSSSGGASAAEIVRCAERYIGSTRFRGPEVDYGNLACAQFVSTALRDAGAVSRVQLGVVGVVADLKSRGWKEVSAPPFMPGDVVTWKTYDRTGDGVKDDDTHIGIMGNDGQAISNSSSMRMPRRHSVYYCPICRVLRLS